MFKTVYVTGAPASGKSSTVRMLCAAVPEMDLWEYGARLTSMLQERDAGLRDQDEIRSRSAQIVRPKDIDELDDRLLTWVEANRATRHLLIDSHPVTKEAYGFRVTACSAERFRALAPSEI